MLGLDENIFEFLEFLTLANQIKVGLEWLLLDYLGQVFVEALQVGAKTVDKVSHSVSSITDSL